MIWSFLYGIMDKRNDSMNDLQFAYQFAKAIEKVNGRAYYVGGYVRDQLLHIDNKDIDIEVHQISIEQLEHVLQQFGEVIFTGKSFGVYKEKALDLGLGMHPNLVDQGNGYEFCTYILKHIELIKIIKEKDWDNN